MGKSICHIHVDFKLKVYLLFVGWHLMMKVPQGGNLGGAANLYDLWTSNFTIAADTENALAVHPGTTYKSRDVLDWDNFNISLVIAEKIISDLLNPVAPYCSQDLRANCVQCSP